MRKNSLKVSKRLERIAAAAGGAVLLADVGCDHGYTAIAALLAGQAERVLCMDINPGPLSAAVRNVSEAGFSDRAGFLLSDGLRGFVLPDAELTKGERAKREAFSAETGARKLSLPERLLRQAEEEAEAELEPRCGGPGRPDVIVISGMGGQLITEILGLLPTNGVRCTEEKQEALLERARKFLSGVRRLVLSPQSEPELVRAFLQEHLGFGIEEEEMLSEEGKYYLIMTAVPVCAGAEKMHGAGTEKNSCTGAETAVRSASGKKRSGEQENRRFGARLFEKRDPVFRQYLTERRQTIGGILPKLPEGERKTDLLKEQEEINGLLAQW